MIFECAFFLFGVLSVALMLTGLLTELYKETKYPALRTGRHSRVHLRILLDSPQPGPKIVCGRCFSYSLDWCRAIHRLERLIFALYLFALFSIGGSVATGLIVIAQRQGIQPIALSKQHSVFGAPQPRAER